jgi:hypothetical protein
LNIAAIRSSCTEYPSLHYQISTPADAAQRKQEGLSGADFGQYEMTKGTEVEVLSEILRLERPSSEQTKRTQACA